VPDSAAAYSYEQIKDGLRSLPLAGAEHSHFVVAVSRSHQSPETREYIEQLRVTHPDLQVVEQGSSYKFCLLAEGAVDLYVRTTPTYEWDTAAGELVLSEAGGATLAFPAETPLQYNKEDLTNPWFICMAQG
jgi:3'(2'), 5'-bisphosphate nucleotidase